MSGRFASHRGLRRRGRSAENLMIMPALLARRGKVYIEPVAKARQSELIFCLGKKSEVEIMHQHTNALQTGINCTDIEEFQKCKEWPSQ